MKNYDLEISSIIYEELLEWVDNYEQYLYEVYDGRKQNKEQAKKGLSFEMATLRDSLNDIEKRVKNELNL